ncbi:hypothetical protein GCG54_00002680 [Colletotrichum gloeosporioides]|uniref:Transmembrane protein n=1 Tax=Colletotrichum gloeosporioides TaxID=474922 RepID=A0A8H4CUK7_COLGL|nr:uncharacterized protein GCG54_00002680 [Colletotrichum gloeosporioides]KAF3810224.1 hypothetical protein GCG54_00002680 [Colletotrichum gloeosporioides]
MSFSEGLRRGYRQLRGFWRYWFSIYKFSHCDFFEFEKFCSSTFSDLGPGLPPEEYPYTEDYFYKPRPARSKTPISPKEFEHIYYHYRKTSAVRINTGYQPFTVMAQAPFYWPRFFRQPPPLLQHQIDGNLPTDTVPKIPQRLTHFDELSNSRETFWGLHAREQISAVMVSIYTLLALMPWFAFCFVYIFGLGGNEVDIQNATTPLTISLTTFAVHENLRFGTPMAVRDAATTQQSPQPDHIASLRTRDAPLAAPPTPQRKTTEETEDFFQNWVVRDSDHKPNITELRTSDVESETDSEPCSRLWVKSLKDSGNSVPLLTRYEPASEQSLIARSAVNRLGLRILPNKPTGRTIKTTFGFLECRAFVSIAVESPLPGNSRLETFNIAVAEDWLVAAQGVELVAGRRIIARLQELGISLPAAISDRRPEVSSEHPLPAISETSASSITERDGQKSLYYSCKDVQHQRAAGLSDNPFDRDDLSLGSSEANTRLTEGSDSDASDWNDFSSVSWSSESVSTTSAESETLSEFGRTFKLGDEQFGERGSGSYNGNGAVYESPSRGRQKGKRSGWANTNTTRAVSSEEPNDDDHSDPAPAENTKLRGNLPSEIVPRTLQCFQVTEGSHRQRIWGLHAREKVSAMMVLIYALLAFMPSLAFCFVYWFGLGDKQPDIQDASTPLTISLTTFGLFMAYLVKL